MINPEANSLKLGQFLINLVIGRSIPQITNFYDNYRQVSRSAKLVSPTQIVFASILGGISGIGIIAIVNLAAAFSENNRYSIILPLLFLLLLIVYRSAQTALISSCATAVELALEETRIRNAKKISMLNLLSFEHLKKQEAQAGLTKHYETIYDLIIPIIQGVNSITLAFFLILYLGYISWQAAGIGLIVTFITSFLYVSRKNNLKKNLSKINSAETRLFAEIDDLYSGYKELKFNTKKRNQVFDNFSKTVSYSSKQRTLSNNSMIEIQVFVTIISYLFAGSVVFLLPLISGHNYFEMGRIIALTLFLINPIGYATEGIQSLLKINFSLESIYKFENMIDRLNYEINHSTTMINFESVRVCNAEFSRHDDEGRTIFSVGPINLTLEPGKIIFVEGGNGSGKTTMMRIISGLYAPTKGNILLNGYLVTDKNIQSYRELFGIIFADFCVFDKPYGLTPEQIIKLRENISKLGLSGCMKENLELGLQPEKLSTGQKKRLALALILTEDRPILIFDEWAADQDPNFRSIFYHEILPQLKSANKSILAITHDDHYFDVADERYIMEDGQIKLIKTQI